jgi:hypothetical protein
VAEKLGERIFIDISSIKSKSYGGTKFWLLVVDDKSDKSWSFFLKNKSDQGDTMLTFLKQMVKDKTAVSWIRADNAGENLTLQKLIEQDPHLKAKLEKTPRDTPQYNGKVERKFQTLWNGTRANLNSSKLPAKIRNGVWAEASVGYSCALLGRLGAGIWRSCQELRRNYNFQEFWMIICHCLLAGILNSWQEFSQFLLIPANN